MDGLIDGRSWYSPGCIDWLVYELDACINTLGEFMQKSWIDASIHAQILHILIE